MLINYKAIGDTLTTAELNAYASLIAHNKTVQDSFKLKNGAITGTYGKYTFDLTNASIVDNGVLITDETLDNGITVKLSNATQKANYTLHLTVLRYGEVSILDEDNNPTIIDLTVPLTEDTTVNIPLSSLQEYDVILFQSNITIKHDKPQITGNFVTGLSITLSPVKIATGQNSTITINATDLQTLPVPNKQIKLYKDGTLLDTLTTDTDGQATKTITGTGAGLTGLYAQYHSVTSLTEYLKDLYYWFVGNETFSTKFVFSNSLTTSTDDDYLKVVNATAQTRYATLSNDGSTNLSFATTDSFTLEYDQYISTTYFRSSVCGQNCQPTLTADTWYHIRVEKHETSIKWYINDELTCTQTQTANGVISLAIGANSTSKIKNIELLMGVPNTEEITLTADQSIIESGSTSTVTAVLTDNGTPLTDETVTFTAKQGATIIDTATATTDSNGECEYEYQGSGLGDITITATHGVTASLTTIEDCTYYNTTVYGSTSVTLDQPLPQQAFTLEYDCTPTTRDSSIPYLDIGRSSNDRILIGQYARSGTNGLILYTGSTTLKPLPNNSTLNTANHYTFTYDGNDYIIDRDGESLTVTGVGIHLDKLIHIESGSGGTITNIKIKPYNNGGA